MDKWNGEEWVTDTDALQAATIRIAEAEKTAHIVEANNVTQIWQTQLLLGLITDADKVSLTAWMKYVQAVSSLDTATVQDIIWPEKPGVNSLIPVGQVYVRLVCITCATVVFWLI
ncbi:tail fiber assembly protein [Erwinia sp. BNK-24-b]|uniref:tail fiber assembly protein n=1 Tax=unclassified Erwinia TaxID=2622719 RepID=UPI0039BFC048